MKEPRKSPPSKPQSKPEDKLDEELEESFPASDPPSNTPTAAGGPERSQTKPPKPDKSWPGWSGAAAIAQLARDGQAFDLVFGITLKGAIFTVQKALPLMREGWLIVLMGRQGGSTGTADFGIYCVSKTAIRNPRAEAGRWTSNGRNPGQCIVARRSLSSCRKMRLSAWKAWVARRIAHWRRDRRSAHDSPGVAALGLAVAAADLYGWAASGPDWPREAAPFSEVPHGATGMKEPRKTPPRKSRAEAEEKLDEELEESFPASDPPANTPTSIGGPARAKRPAPVKPRRRGWPAASRRLRFTPLPG
jgi:hypothetical protein